MLSCVVFCFIVLYCVVMCCVVSYCVVLYYIYHTIFIKFLNRYIPVVLRFLLYIHQMQKVEEGVCMPHHSPSLLGELESRNEYSKERRLESYKK